MPIKREDIIKVDALKTDLSDAFRTFERRLSGVFGELVYAIDTVIDRYNDLERRYDDLERRYDVLERQHHDLERRYDELLRHDADLAQKLDTVSERLLRLEQDVHGGTH